MRALLSHGSFTFLRTRPSIDQSIIPAPLNPLSPTINHLPHLISIFHCSPDDPFEWTSEQWYKEGMGMFAVGYAAEVVQCFEHCLAIETTFVMPLAEALQAIEENRDVQAHDHASPYVVAIVGEQNLSRVVWELFTRGVYCRGSCHVFRVCVGTFRFLKQDSQSFVTQSCLFCSAQANTTRV
jgi:hypothetical protein